MRSLSGDLDSASHSAFIESLSSFSRLHRAQRWEGTFGEFLATETGKWAKAVKFSGAQVD